MKDSDKITIENIDFKIQNLMQIKEVLIKFNNFLCSNVNEEILKRYIQMQSVVKVAEYINDSGFRIESSNGERKYTTNDISELIKSKPHNVDLELYDFSKKLFLNASSKNSKFGNM